MKQNNTFVKVDAEKLYNFVSAFQRYEMVKKGLYQIELLPSDEHLFRLFEEMLNSKVIEKNS